MSATAPVSTPARDEPPRAFDWPLAYEAEAAIARHLAAFLSDDPNAARLAERMRDETGTDFFEWVDHLVLPPSTRTAWEAVGFVVDEVAVPAGCTALHHPRAMLPRVLLDPAATACGRPQRVAIRPERLDDFCAAMGVTAPPSAGPRAGYRWVSVTEELRFELRAVERFADRGFVSVEPSAERVRAIVRAQELWRARRRAWPDDAAAARHAHEVLDRVLALVDRDAACQLFFEEERRYWESRNRAARLQRRRQDRLGLGWGNHDHHTFRCSRAHFVDLIELLRRLGFEKRERYYAGAEAGWGAQILEQATAGIVVFADVDLLPEETQIDFSTRRLPPAPALRTVGLWCGLHGDSLFEAGMHHLEARFDFERLRDQLGAAGVSTMKPFSDFPFLRQAFTEGERWPVVPARADRLLAAGLITPEQHAGFRRDGAVGSHLENLQRKGGFKGFNQKSVSAIIAATDPRALQQTVH